MLIRRIGYILLIVFNGFLAVTAAAGGLGLLTGAISPGLELLAGSPFGSYTIPGLALLMVVGGSALAATILLIRRHPLGSLAAVLAGVMIMGFELVEVLVIGSDPGLARNLQLFYFVLGLSVAGLGSWLWVAEHGLSVADMRRSLQQRV
jgi:hypothetical protein